MYKIIFLGTSGFAVPSLQKLAADKNFKIELVVTRPDAEIGRKKVLTKTPIKTVAQQLGINVVTPENLKDRQNTQLIKKLKPDFLIVAAYGQILGEELLSCAKYGAINIHPSLLPKYRGPSPVQFAIWNGEKETGVSIILMDEEIDHGQILAQQTVKIYDDETAPESKARLGKIAAALLPDTLINFALGKINSREQDHRRATFTKILKRTDGHVNWKKSAQEIYNMWRAFEPWPGIFSQWRIKNGQSISIKLNRVCLVDKKIFTNNEYGAGEIFIINKKIFVKCGQGAIEILRLQLEGKNEIGAEEFINGYPSAAGKILQ